jgi:hypothetical protein
MRVLDDAMNIVCNPELPGAWKVWRGIAEKSGERLGQASATM